jgi:hypothetical protein
MMIIPIDLGNRRVGGATSEELRQCVLDIKSWFKRKSSLRIDDSSGASPEDFQRMKKALDQSIPEVLFQIPRSNFTCY